MNALLYFSKRSKSFLRKPFKRVIFELSIRSARFTLTASGFKNAIHLM